MNTLLTVGAVLAHKETHPGMMGDGTSEQSLDQEPTGTYIREEDLITGEEDAIAAFTPLPADHPCMLAQLHDATVDGVGYDIGNHRSVPGQGYAIFLQTLAQQGGHDALLETLRP